MGLSVSSSGIKIPFVSGQYYNSALTGLAIPSQALSAFDFRCSRFVYNSNLDFTSVRFNVQTIGTALNAKIYIFDSNSQGLPNDTPIFTSSNIDISTNGIKSTSLSYTFLANKIYWVALQVDGIATIYCVPAGACSNLSDNSTATYISLRKVLANFNVITNLTSQVDIPNDIRTTILPINFSFLKA